MSKVLTLKDRFRLFKRLLKMIFDKDYGYVVKPIRLQEKYNV